MTTTTNSATGRIAGRRREGGAVLTMVLVFYVVIGLVVMSMLAFASTLMRSRPPINERNARVEAARSAMRMAIQFQRDTGVGECFEDSTTFTFNAGTPEEVTAHVSCDIGPVEELENNYYRDGGDAYALILTVKTDSTTAIEGSSAASAATKLVEGNVFVSGGAFDTAQPLDDVLVGNQTDGQIGNLYLANDGEPTALRYGLDGSQVTCDEILAGGPFSASATVDGELHSNTQTCVDHRWTDRAGTRALESSAWTYPALPAIPANRRPTFNPRQFGHDESRPGNPECKVVFPGRWDTELVFDDGATYYLPSGIYYLTEPMRISNGSKVVAGEGRELGCEVDSTVLLDSRTTSRETPAVTGRGATFVLDGDATIELLEGELYVNRRISTPSTRGSEGLAIRSVQVAEIDSYAYVPEDEVVTGVDADSNRIMTPAGSYQTEGFMGGTLQYVGTSAGPDQDLVSVDFRDGGASGAPAGTNAFVVDGSIFVPQGKLQLAADNPDYRMVIDGGVVAARAVMDLDTLPVADEDFFVGIDASPLLRRVTLTATASTNGITARSVAVFQLNSVGNYAVNSWIVDPNWAGGNAVPPTTVPPTTAPPTTVPPTTAPSTTVPPTTAPSTTVPPTTVPPTTVPPTTVPPTTAPACPVTPADEWQADLYNGTGFNRFKHSAVVDSPNFDWGSGAPRQDLVGRDTFSLAFTTTTNLPDPGVYRFTVGGDDGVRLFVNGSRVINAWWDQSYTEYQADVQIEEPCGVMLEFHFYENGGLARVGFDMERVGDLP